MLDAALAVFAEYGYDGATLDAIAERAEFGKGTLYNYFPGGKEELFLTLFKKVVFQGLMAVVNRTLTDTTALQSREQARETFGAFIEGVITHFQEAPDALLLFMKEGQRIAFDPDKVAFFAAHYNQVIDRLEQAAAQAIDAGALRDLPPRSIAHLLMGNVRGYLAVSVGAQCHPETASALAFPSTSEAAAFMTSVLFDGLLPDVF